MARIIYFFFVIVLLVIFIAHLGMAKECECKTNWQDECLPCDDSEKAGEATSKALKEGKEVNADFQTEVPVDDDGLNLIVSGKTNVDDEKMDTEEAETESGAQMQNVEGLSGDGKGGFKADYSESFSYMGFSASNAYDIHGTEKSLTIGNADKVKYNGITLTNAELLHATEDQLSIISADKVQGQGLEAEDVMNTNLKFDNGLTAKIISSEDNNTISFNGMNVTMDKHDVVNFTKAGDKYNVDLDSENATVRDTGNVACADISAGSRYRYVGEDYDTFGLYIPSEADNFNLCIRTKADEQYPTNCSQCGVMDFYNQSFVLNGEYEYEKKDAVDPRLFTDVIKADGNFSANLSQEAEDITYLYPDNGRTFSSIFEVKYWENDKGFRFAGFNKPYTIHEIYPNIKITEQRL